jgi:hypothetical protein
MCKEVFMSDLCGNMLTFQKLSVSVSGTDVLSDSILQYSFVNAEGWNAGNVIPDYMAISPL